MENDKIFLDSLEINDSGLHGFVILTDKNTGKVLFKKHNLVVNGGKQYIFDLFLAKNIHFGSGSGTSGKLLRWLVFGSGLNETSFSDSTITTLPGDANNGKFDLAVQNNDKVSTTIGSTTGKINVNYLKFKINFAGTDILASTDRQEIDITELGLYLDNAATGDWSVSNTSLFSRIKFDRIPITNTSEFNLEYYVYF